MTTIHTFIVDPAEEARSAVAAAMGDDEPWVAHDSLPQVAQSIDRGSLPAVVLVGPGVVHDDTIMLADSIQDERLPVRLIQFAKVLDPDRLRDAMRAGVADVVEVEARRRRPGPSRVGRAPGRQSRPRHVRADARRRRGGRQGRRGHVPGRDQRRHGPVRPGPAGRPAGPGRGVG
jgi:hypothetical protein